jgi:Ca2+-binding RTX toxin-like protein
MYGQGDDLLDANGGSDFLYGGQQNDVLVAVPDGP